MPGPLDGIRIIDLTAVVLGPVATLHLADMGADVIKVEPPEGDTMRNMGNPPTPKMGPIYMAMNRNKRSLCLDLKKPAAVEALKRLITTADVLVHNSRPQAIERLGLGYADVKALNPRIIYAYSLGYKRSGPYGKKPAYDDLVQGVSGAAMLQSRVDGGPPRFLPTLAVDKTTGLHLGMAVLAALFHRERTGVGQQVEVPMLETVTGFWLIEHMFNGTYVPARGNMGYARVLSPDRRPYPTKDGYVCAVVYTPRHWTAFAEKVGRPELLTDPRFATPEARANHQPQIQKILADEMPSRTTAEWLDFFDETDIPAMGVNDLEDLPNDPHLKATGYFTERDHPTEGRIRTVASPFEFTASPTSYRLHAPHLGADGPDVLAEAGLSASEIAELREAGALKVTSPGR
jgi:crotonobetainyl-CoA:carnitine CoA-transferase CaiB-like acyl-CoA transferase